MSTISDALKKVQRQRLAEPRVARAERVPRPSHAVALLLIVTMLVAATFLALRRTPIDSATQPPARELFCHPAPVAEGGPGGSAPAGRGHRHNRGRPRCGQPAAARRGAGSIALCSADPGGVAVSARDEVCPWSYALDARVRQRPDLIRVRRRPRTVGDPWTNSPLWLEVPARRMRGAFPWNLYKTINPPRSAALSLGPGETLRLVPYGCTNLRIAYFPVGTPRTA